MGRFQTIDRQKEHQFPAIINEWIPENHQARFIVEAVDKLNLSKITQQYKGSGTLPYNPKMMLSLLIYSYSIGVFSSRQIEQATYESIPTRFITANDHPDHSTIAEFRRRFHKEFEDIFVQVLELAHEMKLLKLGQVSVDGTKLHANASRHSALSYGHIEKLKKQFQQEVEQLMEKAKNAEQHKIPEDMNVLDEIQLREERIALMEKAQRKIERRAEERYQREKAEYERKMMKRLLKEKESGKKSKRKLPEAPESTPRDKDQINLTDEESRIMKCSGGAFEQCYNAQAAVDTDSYLIVSAHVTQAANDKQQVAPMLEELRTLPERLGAVNSALMDAGYFSEENVELCEKIGIEPYIAVGRESHHLDVMSRFTEPDKLPDDASTSQKMRHKLKTKKGRAIYSLRKSTVEPVFGIIKSVMGFRQFSLRSLEKVNGEWDLVCLSWNLKRMAKLCQRTVFCG